MYVCMSNVWVWQRFEKNDEGDEEQLRENEEDEDEDEDEEDEMNSVFIVNDV